MELVKIYETNKTKNGYLGVWIMLKQQGGDLNKKCVTFKKDYKSNGSSFYLLDFQKLM